MTTPTISISTELMKNYKQTLLMSPEKKFEGLQTSTGNSLLFSIGTDNVFYVTEESVDHGTDWEKTDLGSKQHATGWEKTDLSSKQIAQSFPGQTGLTCKTFDVAQSVVDGTIGIAMVVSDGTNDHLFLCLGNSNSDTSWVEKPSWTQYPFDNPAKNITIAGVLLSETVDNTQYIVVDILRDPASAEKLISRYYIDTNGSPAWQPHDVSIDLEANSYTSCLGRQYLPHSPHQPTIDGLYTSGQVDGEPQLIFQPLYNEFNTKIPAPAARPPARLQLPNGLIAESIASCRKNDLSTDLYACSAGGLYYFASSNQADGATGVLVTQSTWFNGVHKMYAAQSNNISIVWGLNGNDEIFYVSCPVGQETASPSQWSYPLPISTEVDLFSPYLNRVDDANTFFAVAGDTLQKLVKSPETSIWRSQSITLPSLDHKDTQKYSSYTTTIQVTDENKRAMPDTSVTISASSKTAVYINHLYYLIDSKGIEVKTDSFGNVTVVEWVDSLTGTALNVRVSDGNAVAVNPMDTPMSKVAQLNSVDSLKKAKITNDDGSTYPLVSSSVSPQDLATVAAKNQQLGDAYTKLSSSNQSPSEKRMTLAKVHATTLTVGTIDAIWVDAGDLFRWLESDIEAVIEIIEDEANRVWHFVVTIAGKVYACVLDAAEKVAAAVVWVFNVIKTAIEDLIKFLEFLFGWEDILITHRVMKNVFIQLTQQGVNDLIGYKAKLTSVFQAMQNDVNKWANIPDVNQTPGGTTRSNNPPAGYNSSPGNLGIHHFQGNVDGAGSSITPLTITEDVFKDLLNLMESEETTLKDACDAIKKDIIDQFDTLTATEIIQRFLAIVTDTLLQTADNILQAALDVFIQLVEGAVGLLTQTIEIPVLSWLYKELTGDDLSFIDLVCLIGAIPATIMYKIGTAAAAGTTEGVAPFPQNDAFTNGLLNATSFAQIQSLFFTGRPVQRTASRRKMRAAPMAQVAEMAEAPVLDDSRMKTFSFVTSIFAFIGSVVLIYTTTVQRVFEALDGTVPNQLPKTVATVSAVGNLCYVSPNIGTFINAATDNWYQQMNNVITGISLIKGFVNIPIAVAENPNFGKASAFVESFINFVWNLPVIMNIVDYSSRWDTNYKSLIPESMGNFAFNIGGIMEFPIALVRDPETKAIASLVQYGLMLVYGICMPIAGGIYQFEPGQDHS